MLSTTIILIVGIAFVAFCLAAFYFLAIRINRQSNTIVNDSIAFKNESPANEEIFEKINHKTKIAGKKVAHEPDNAAKALSSVIVPKSKSELDDDDEDIIALAALKGYDITGIRRRNKLSAKENNYKESILDSGIGPKLNISETKSDLPADPASLELSAMKSSFVNPDSAKTDAENIKSPIFLSESRPEKECYEWNHVRTREEETIRILKAKIDTLQSELEISDNNCLHNARSLERSQRSVSLLEQELKEQKKIFSSAKISNDAQISSLRLINRELTAKLATIEADSLNASFSKAELDKAKDIISRLQIDFEDLQKEKSELFHQLSEFKRDNEELKNQAFIADALNIKCAKLEEASEEMLREFNIQLENSRAELKSTRSKLESEIAFHRAEHANSIGSSTALHQEIAQLKADVSLLSEREAESKLKSDNFEKSNVQLLLEFEELNSSQKSYLITISELESQLSDSKEKISSLKWDFEKQTAQLADIQVKFDNCMSKCESLEFDLKNYLAEIEIQKSNIEILKSELEAKEIEIASLSSQISMASSENTDKLHSDEIEILRCQLAEAEIKISGLQSDLAREIKRADISKKVYEAKLAELKKN